MTRIIHRALMSWQAWRSRRRLNRSIPILADLDRQLAEYRRSHKHGAAKIIKAKREAIHAALAGRR